MDFTPTDEQQAIAELAEQVIAGTVDPDRLAALEAKELRVDDGLWTELVHAGLVGLPVPAAAGGAGLGLVELGLVLEAQGRHVAKVPLWSTAVAAWTLALHGGDAHTDLVADVLGGGRRVTLAVEEYGTHAAERPATSARPDGDGWVLDGEKALVPDLPAADRMLVTASTPDGTGVFLVDPGADTVTVLPADTTGQVLAADVRLDGTPAVRVGDDATPAWLLDRVRVALAWLQAGVARGAMERGASYVSEREQFGRPLGTFQAVAHRIADCWIDVQAMRATALQAAWLLDQPADDGVDHVGTAVPVAAWWASDAGQRVVHAVMHLHGGMGVDLDHPIHRYFLLGREIADSLGGPSQDLDRLGSMLDVLPELAP